MGDFSGRIRAAFSPSVLLALLLCAVLLLILQSGNHNGETVSLEKRIEEAISRIEGVGEVKVVIRTRPVYRDQRTSISQDAAESVPCGAVAVAEGAEDPLVRARISRSLCALLGLQASDVDVLSMSEGG